jgi:hypothetical protein
MKRILPMTLLAVVFGLVGARPADAQSGIIRWIEKLSGPGPLKAYGYELYPFCVGKNTQWTRGGREPLSPASIDNQPYEVGLDLNCRAFSRNHRLAKIGFQVADFWGDNQLEYDASVPDSLTDTVHGKIYAVTADLSLYKGRFDVGGSFGRMYFTGAPAGPFSHPLYEVRGTLNILPIVNWGGPPGQQTVPNRYRNDWIQFRLSINIVPGGLEDTDFGAIPGTFPRTETEVSVRPTLLVNLGNAFGW